MTASKAGGLVPPQKSGYNPNQTPVLQERTGVKIRRWEAENSRYSHPNGRPPAPVRRPSPERSALANSDEHRMTLSVEAARLRLIQQRLQTDFYEVPPASEQIAASVLADLKDFEGSASDLPQ